MRRATIAAALLLVFTALVFQAVELPGRVLACSCAGPPPSLAEVAARDEVTIIAGTVGRALPDRTPIGVDGWFHGAAPTDVVWLAGGTQMMSSCDISMSPGERRVLVLYGGPQAPGAGGLYSTNMCAPQGVIGTTEGDAMLASAIELFGAPLEPPTPEPEPAAPIDLQPWLGDGLLWAAAAVAVGLVMLGAAALVARRRPGD